MIKKRTFFARLVRLPKVIVAHYEILRRYEGRVTSLWLATRMGVLILQ